MLHHNTQENIKVVQLPRCLVNGCTETESLTVNRHYKRADGSTKTYYICNEHNSERKYNYYHTAAGKESVRRANARYLDRKLMGVL